MCDLRCQQKVKSQDCERIILQFHSFETFTEFYFRGFCYKAWGIDYAIGTINRSFKRYVSFCESTVIFDSHSFLWKKLVRCQEGGDIALTMCCRLKVRRLFSSLSREMLTFSRLIQHNLQVMFAFYLYDTAYNSFYLWYDDIWQLGLLSGWKMVPFNENDSMESLDDIF